MAGIIIIIIIMKLLFSGMAATPYDALHAPGCRMHGMKV
jgi:hypothetical protein